MFFLRLPFYAIFCSIVWGTYLWISSHIPNLNSSIELENSLLGWILCVLIIISICLGIVFCVVLPVIVCIKFEIDWKNDLLWEIDFWYGKATRRF